MIRKILGLSAFVLTGVGLMVLTIIKDKNLFNTIFLILTGCFFSMGLTGHFNELKN